MFERFTERARQVVVQAQDDARALGHDYIGTEHLLLGLTAEPGHDCSAEILASFDVGISDVQAAVVRLVGRGSHTSPGQIPFRPEAKKMLELANREAEARQHSHVGTEHLLMGLLRVDPSTAIEVLLDENVDPERVRAAVIERLKLVPRQHVQAGVSAASRSPRPGAIPRVNADSAAVFQIGPDPSLHNALRAAAARALREGREQYGIPDVLAAMELDPPPA